MSLRFHISETRVEVVGLPDEAARGLAAVWGEAGPLLPTRYEVRLEVEGSDAGYTLRTDGELRLEGVSRADLLATVEQVLYHDLAAWTPPSRVLLHAAAVHLGGTTFVLAGASGAGKSSLAFALLGRGALYLSDELTLFDGARVWGVPRAPQLDSMPMGQRLPEGFPDADLASYQFAGTDGPRVLPLLPLRREQIAPGPYPAATVRLVFPHRDEVTRARVLPAAEALRRLHAELRSEVARDLGPLFGRSALELAWRTPEEGADVLARAPD